MRRTLFKKYLGITSSVILVSFLILSLVMLIFISGYWKNEKRGLLRKNAESVAGITAASAISVTRNEYTLDARKIQNFTMAFAQNIDSDIFITQTGGQLVLAAFGSGGDVDSTKKIGQEVMKQALAGRYSAEGTLGGVYKRPYYIVGVPITVETAAGPTAIGAVFAAYGTSSFNAFRGEMVKIFLLAAIAAFLVSFCIVWLFSYRMVQPLRKMAAAARAFGEGDFSVRVPVCSEDEIGQLSVAFNHMADSLASSEGARRNFIANVSHELKTPMTTIAGFVDGILDGTIPPEKERHYLMIVSQEVKRLSRLVRTMLSLSRIDSGELRLNPARFDLTNTVLLVLLSFEQKIEAKKIDIQGIGDAESLFVNGDPDMIHQVVYNLVDNAVKFTNEGGYIRITVTEKPDRAVVSVENSGAGIAPEDLPLVFDRFYKADKSRSREKNGLGLGLYIVRTIIHLHGGEITAESEFGRFCRFTFWLPKKAEPPHERDGQRRLVETTAGRPAAPEK